MAGFQNDSNLKEILFADNVDFSGATTPTGQVTSNGQLLIGSSVAPNIRVGNLTSPDGSLTVVNGNGTIGVRVTNDLHVAKWIVNQTANSGGNNLTIQSAINNATSGDTVFIFPGTYNENLTLKAGVNLTAFGSDSSLNGTGTVIINGTCSFSSAGSVTIQGIMLQTNSAALLSVTGSAASVVNLNNCYLNCTNNTGITFSAANTSAQINLFDCNGNIGTTGITLFSDSSTGTFNMVQSNIQNTGNTTTASTKSAGNFMASFSQISMPLNFSSSSASGSGTNLCYWNTAAQNATCITTSGTGTLNVTGSVFSAGTASSLSVGNGTTVNFTNCTINSSNTNAITGAGTIKMIGTSFGTSQVVNVTTQTGGTLTGLTNISPSAGFLGERISSAATAVSMATGTPTNIVSITLTPGVWDLVGQNQAAGSTTNIISLQTAISTNSASFTGTTAGDSSLIQWTNGATNSQNSSVTIAGFRAAITTSTTYFLVGQVSLSSGTCTGNGRITGTRVG